jgi:hypothetical protein
VDQAKTSPFGQFVIAQAEANDPHLQQFITQTGFDPTRDLDELLVASNGNTPQAAHLTLARGTFNTSQIDAAANAGGAISETYKGLTITEDPKRSQGFAFLTSTIAVAGDVASVKAAIDRQAAPSTLPASLLVLVNQLSTTEDAWGLSLVAPPAIAAPSAEGNIPNLPATALQNIQQATGGVKFGPQIVANSQLQLNTAENANTLATGLEFLLSLGQMQAQQRPQAAAVLKDVTIAASGNLINISAVVPEAQAESFFQLKPKARASTPPHPSTPAQGF